MAFALPILMNLPEDQPPPREYRVRERKLANQFSDAELKRQTRLTRFQFEYLLHRIGPLIESHSNSSLTIAAETKLIAVLDFLATGEFQRCCSQKYGFVQSKMSEFIGQVVEAIITLTPEFVHMPNSPEAMQDVADEFEAMYGFPQVLGCIDGTLVTIQTPTEDEHIFVDRKGHHSINCQVICDSHMRIMDVVARWPGSVHDGGIFEVSEIKHRFDNDAFGDYKLLGDTGYRLTPYLLTIYRPAETDAENIFNQLHKSTRCTVERCVGLLKGRWRCLHSTGGNLIYTPGKVCRMFLACCILHNICFMTEDGGLAEVDEDLIQMDDVDEQVNDELPEDEVFDLRDDFVAAHPVFHAAFHNM